MSIEWGVVAASIVLGLLAYAWHQARKVDTMYQTLYGVEGKNGMNARLEALERDAETVDKRIEASRHLLRTELTVTLNRGRDGT